MDFVNFLLKQVENAFQAIQNGQEYTAQSTGGGQVVVVERPVNSLRSAGSHTFQSVPAYWATWSVGTPVRNGVCLSGTVMVKCEDPTVLRAFLTSALDVKCNYRLQQSLIPNSIVVLPVGVIS